MQFEMNEKKNLLVIAIVFLIVVVLWSIYQRDEGEAAPADAPALQRQTPREALRAAPRARDLVEVPEFPVGLNLSTVDLTARALKAIPAAHSRLPVPPPYQLSRSLRTRLLSIASCSTVGGANR